MSFLVQENLHCPINYVSTQPPAIPASQVAGASPSVRGEGLGGAGGRGADGDPGSQRGAHDAIQDHGGPE